MECGYTAWTRREDLWWVIEIPELGETVRAPLLIDADRAARERVALSLGVGTDEICLR